MIIWLNGPFGVGKTQVAHELRERLPGGFVFDPEEIGFALAKVTPRERQTGDFQDLPLWRAFTRQALEDVAVRAQGPVIVPMTLVEPLYFAEVVGVLRASGLEVRHFALLAGREVILRRLRGRLDGPGSWPARQLDRCLEALQDDRFAETGRA